VRRLIGGAEPLQVWLLQQLGIEVG